jgi:hypothetical protein
MKTTLLILALCLFSFSMESSANIEKVAIHHRTQDGSFIELKVSQAALEGHLIHGDNICLPPCRP